MSGWRSPSVHPPRATVSSRLPTFASSGSPPALVDFPDFPPVERFEHREDPASWPAGQRRPGRLSCPDRVRFRQQRRLERGWLRQRVEQRLRQRLVQHDRGLRLPHRRRHPERARAPRRRRTRSTRPSPRSRTSARARPINYNPTGSGAGIKQFIAGQVDFAGSDSALKTKPVNGKVEAADAAKACGSPALGPAHGDRPDRRLLQRQGRRQARPDPRGHRQHLQRQGDHLERPVDRQAQRRRHAAQRADQGVLPL